MPLIKLTATLETTEEIKAAKALVRGGRLSSTVEFGGQWIEKRTSHRPPRILRLWAEENGEQGDATVLEVDFGESGSTLLAATILWELIHGTKGEEQPSIYPRDQLSPKLPGLVKSARAAKTNNGQRKFIIQEVLVHPLVRRAEDFELHMSLREESLTGPLVFPVFRWSFGPPDNIRTDTLCGWPHQGSLVYHDQSIGISGEITYFDTLEEALAVVDEHGWGEPTHIYVVFMDMLDISAQFSEGIPEDAERIFAELREKWERLIAEAA